MAANNKKVNVEVEETVSTFTGKVIPAKLNVRSRMSTQSEIITVVDADTELTLENSKSVQWYKVTSPVSGFVMAEFVSVM